MNKKTRNKIVDICLNIDNYAKYCPYENEIVNLTQEICDLIYEEEV